MCTVVAGVALLTVPAAALYGVFVLIAVVIGLLDWVRRGWNGL